MQGCQTISSLFAWKIKQLDHIDFCFKGIAEWPQNGHEMKDQMPYGLCHSGEKR
jgi:hypothetical protein